MLAQETNPKAVAGYDETALRDHLLAAMRAGSLRLLLAKADLDTIGTALKGRPIRHADLVALLDREI
jgi:hypothetical protein